MKKIKKSTVSFASAAAILASFAAMTASAASINAYSVSYETLTAAITTTDGSTIPAGSVAVTMSINHNTGFNANTLTLDIDEDCSVLTDADGKPIVEKGAVLAGALTSAAVSADGTTLCVVSASAAVNSTDGALFTVYFAADAANTQSGFVSIDDTEPAVATGISSAASPFSANFIIDYYIVGDTNDEEIVRDASGAKLYAPVDAVDAANVLMLVAEHGTDFDVIALGWDVVDLYFTEAAHYDAPDADKNKYIDNEDAADMLDYSAIVGAGNVGSYNGPIGEEIPFIPRGGI